MEYIDFSLLALNLINLSYASYIFEKKLHKELLADYNLDVRPEIGFERPVFVKFDLIFEKVNKLNVKQQVLDISVFITLTWNDPQLKWNVSRFDQIDEIIMSPRLIWTPDIVLFNAAEKHSSHSDFYKKKISVGYNGDIKVSW